MRNGVSLKHWCLLSNGADDLPITLAAKSSMRFCKSCAPVVSGVTCHMICRLGKRCTRTFAHGAWMARGNPYTIAYAARCAARSVVIPKLVPPSWTAKRSRRRKKGAARLRCGKENHRQKKAYFDRHARFASRTARARREYSRPCGCERFTTAIANQTLASEKNLG